MAKGIKRFFEQKFLTKIESIDDKACFNEIGNVLEQAFQNAMTSDDFAFNHYSDFTENLNQVLDSGGKIFVAKCAKRIVGTLSVKPEEVDAWYYSGSAVNVCHFAVLPEYQGMGLGRMLLDSARDYSSSMGVPMRLTTPEKNVNAIRVYEKYGFSKVKMYKAGDHYAVYLFYGNGKSEYTHEHCKLKYEDSALLSLMKNRQICSYQTDEKIQKRWEKEFLKYMQDKSAEQCDDMRKCFRAYGITPREYTLYGFENKTPAQRSKYLSLRTITALNENADLNFDKKSLTDKNSVSASEMDEFAPETVATVRAVTVKSGDSVRLAFATINLTQKDNNKKLHFAGIDVEDGTITSQIYRVSGAARKKSKLQLEKTQLPSWNELQRVTVNCAEKLDGIILGFDLSYTKNGWVITNIAKKPSFVNLQLISKGLRLKVEEILGEKIDVKISL